ncbi:hypothetical protein [Blastopirellula marina]|uniref:Uncharacterized protein n=1 Tax=Blastopirellula marina TaxID=124 RepID=A0A2S8GSJ3_9BACT|nr:hypothetical protein [Blastopirellula marina]PQO47398.1 hypothetical protein C5Y93_04970 [Blastopirellula marina]
MATKKKPAAKKTPKKRQPKLTPKQRKLVSLMPEVEAGRMTKQQAMLEAGYADSTAHQQSTILGGLRTNTKMQEALQKAGFTEEYLATGIVDGTMATRPSFYGDKADYQARGVFYKLGAELMDAFPAKKTINAEVGVEQILDEVEGGADPAEWGKQGESK